METTGIFYFSGTGNCFATAKQIAAGFENSEITAITDSLVAEGKPVEYTNCVVIFPAYGYGIPNILYRFFKSITIKASYLAAIVIYGSQPGAALLHAKRLCKRNGQKKLDYAVKIKSVENFLPMFKLKPDEKIASLIKRQSEITNGVIQDIKQKKIRNRLWFIRPFTGFVSILFRSVTRTLSNNYKISDACTKCGICRDICPAHAIEIRENSDKACINPSKCEICQACLNFCPKQAINFLRLKPKSRRYHHPAVTVAEMRAAAASNSAPKTVAEQEFSTEGVAIQDARTEELPAME